MDISDLNVSDLTMDGTLTLTTEVTCQACGGSVHLEQQIPLEPDGTATLRGYPAVDKAALMLFAESHLGPFVAIAEV